MAAEVPRTLLELEAACRKENPVNIAGYGRESTHKGYLSWILSSGRNRLAANLVRMLTEQLASGTAPSKTCNMKCSCEQRLGSHRVDLLVEMVEPAQEKAKLLAIELKTDAGPSGERQFEAMSGYARANEYLGCLVLCLGSSSIQNHKWHDFKQLGPEDLLKLWSSHVDDAPPFVHDWMESLAHEVSRQNLAHDVYRQIGSTLVRAEDLHKFGYRSYKHLMFYVYALYRKYLIKREQARTWSIYDGGYNAVMNLDECADNWHPTGIANVRWFFEFNNDRMCLKLEQNSDELKAVADWANHCVGAFESANLQNKPAVKRTSQWKKGWPMVAFWNVGFRDFDETYARMNSIFRDFGISGILGTL